MPTPALGPYIPLYAKEVLGDVNIASLTDDQFGRLVRYWCVLSEIGGRLPGDPQEIARRSRVDVRKVRHDLSWFPRFFVRDESDGSWRSERMERQSAKYMKKVDTARVNGNRSTPEMGESQDPEIDPYMGIGSDPDSGVPTEPRNRPLRVRGTQSQTQERESTDNPSSPPTPLAGGGGGAAATPNAAKRSRVQKREDELLAIPEISDEHIRAARTIQSYWRKTDPSDGRKVGCDERLLVMRLAAICKRQSLYTMDVLVEAGRIYCEKDLPRFSAPEYFFSLREDPRTHEIPFKAAADAIVTRNRRAARREIAQKAPQEAPALQSATLAPPTPLPLVVG